MPCVFVQGEDPTVSMEGLMKKRKMKITDKGKQRKRDPKVPTETMMIFSRGKKKQRRDLTLFYKIMDSRHIFSNYVWKE